MKQVYVAGPFFNPEERARMNRLKEYLLTQPFEEEYEFFFPMDHFIPDGENMSNKDWAEAVYYMDLNALLSSNFVIAIYDGHYSDSGTAFEIGYASANNIPCYVLFTNLDCDQSLMIVNSPVTLRYNYEEFINGNKSKFLSLETINQK